MLLTDKVEFYYSPVIHGDIEIKKCIDSQIPLENIKLPKYEEGNLGIDFYCPAKYVIQPHATGIKVHTGIAIGFPKGLGMLLVPRSSYGTKTTLRLSNSVGIIDTTYTGEICAVFDNIGDEPQIIERGERFCQGMLIPAYIAHIKEVTSLKETKRGSKGFGSTGKF